MNTPIVDFGIEYANKNTARFHMPGHKGKGFLGVEKYDITEIDGADVLSAAQGIIYESEKNASSIFNTSHTYYTTQGSTTAIYTMLALVKKQSGVILAARNVHKSFIHACAILDMDVQWLLEGKNNTLLKCEVTAKTVEDKILSMAKKPVAVYLTSPDYLGNIQNIPEIAEVCVKYDVPLLVDNAHGAYLGFLEKSLHPIHLGATVCSDSAHKTLPVLTGGAYLHISKNAPAKFLENARTSLTLFSSTSPSYIILQSLDLCNQYLKYDIKEELKKCVGKIEDLKHFIKEKGFCVLDSEPLKITIDCNGSGYKGEELANILRKSNAEPEFYDDRFLVLMLTPQNNDSDFELLKKVFSDLKPKNPIITKELEIKLPVKKMSVRDAVFSEYETVDVKRCVGRICAAPTVSCPPAVPIAVSGEEITEETAQLFKYYGIDKILVVKE
ncbi:MAG: aminotransferase class I/II-fold pyridoxal phosphate-dependent enzyme [Clostridia bacterium]|nr:aminotransferase class I/II-fold pyridoxal phosphate-dependent enzyme [Clostridia bacterium]